MKYSRCGLTSAEYRETINALSLLVILLFFYDIMVYQRESIQTMGVTFKKAL